MKQGFFRKYLNSARGLYLKTCASTFGKFMIWSVVERSIPAYAWMAYVIQAKTGMESARWCCHIHVLIASCYTRCWWGLLKQAFIKHSQSPSPRNGLKAISIAMCFRVLLCWVISFKQYQTWYFNVDLSILHWHALCNTDLTCSTSNLLYAIAGKDHRIQQHTSTIG